MGMSTAEPSSLPAAAGTPASPSLPDPILPLLPADAGTPTSPSLPDPILPSLPAAAGTPTSPSLPDPILPSLRSIRASYDDYLCNPAEAGPRLRSLLEDCIRDFSDNSRYRDDERFLKICIIYGDVSRDFERIFGVLEEKGICRNSAMLYESHAMFHIAKGNLLHANNLYMIGIYRKAQPLDNLKKSHSLFLKHVGRIIQNDAPRTAPICEIEAERSQKRAKCYVDPYSSSTIDDLLRKMDAKLKKLNGYCRSSKPYAGKGKVPLTSLQNSSRNEIIELGNDKYQIKGCAGTGAYAQVYKAYIDSSPDNVVALKVQKPPCPWEFYMYRQLDNRISDVKRSSFGFAHKLHIYSDCSVLVCDYLSLGTLHDAINSYLVKQTSMEEVVCMYYTIEMLEMLEVLHDAGIIHGDFKPDNLLVRYARDALTLDGFSSRTGPWRDQGLCLVDWGKGIDVNLFPADTEFYGDCRTSGFRCVEMQQNRPWTYQVDSYALCVNVHMMLHGSYMSVEKKATPDGSDRYLPKAPFKRDWNAELWKNLFSTLLNIQSNNNDVMLLRNLKKSFVDYICNDKVLIKKLTLLLAKQRASLCSA